MADVISTDLPHAHIVEAALGELQNAVIIADSAALLADAGTWQKLSGRVTVLPADRLLAFKDGYVPAGGSARPAMDLVRCDPRHALLAYQLLGKTLVVETLAEALALADAAPRDYRFVTHAGEVVEAATFHQTLQLGDMSRRGGMISRRAEVAKLEEDLIEVEVRVEAFTQEIAQCDQAARALDGRLQELRGQIYQADNARAETNAQLQQAASQLQRTGAEAPLLAGEMESIDRQGEANARRQAELEARVGELEEMQREVEKVIHEMGAQVIVRQHEVAELSEIATRARVTMGQVQEQRSSLSLRLAAARQAAQQTQVELQRIAGDAEAVAARIADARITISAAERKLAEFGERAAAAEAELGRHTAHIATLREESAGVTSAIEGLQEQAEALARQEHELALGKSELSVRIETLIEHTREELQINLPEEYAARLNPLATEEATAVAAEALGSGKSKGVNSAAAAGGPETDWDAVAEEINELKGKIARLGNVNLDAINELAALEERQKFISGQLADIAAAKLQLEELIGRINEDSKVRFVETFNAVRAEFQDMFRKLFGGGKADLVLENPEDVLESGIEILARPPGKELQSISLLSGGEKTMAAVALVLSVFKSKPSPFCILDEVDAALDEANTARFAAIVQEFLDFSQFVLITHNKQSMSVANVLYGVTMQEQGVSKRVAVRFDQQGNPPALAGPGAPSVVEQTAAA